MYDSWYDEFFVYDGVVIFAYDSMHICVCALPYVISSTCGKYVSPRIGVLSIFCDDAYKTVLVTMFILVCIRIGLFLHLLVPGARSMHNCSVRLCACARRCVKMFICRHVNKLCMCMCTNAYLAARKCVCDGYPCFICICTCI